MPTSAAPYQDQPLVRRVRQSLRHYRWIVRSKIDRFGVAWRYATGRSRLEDGYDLMRHGEKVTGCFALEYLGTEGLIETARFRFEPSPQIEELAHDAAEYVAEKWNSNGHTRGAAEDWALEKMAEYAADRGIELKEVEW